MCNKKSKIKNQNSKLFENTSFHQKSTTTLNFKLYTLHLWRSQNGQTLMELIVVILVSTLVIGALVFATIASLRNAQFAKNQAQATKLAQEGIERVRIGRDRNQCINNLDTAVHSWSGNSSNTSCSGSGSIWAYPITGNSSNCENTTLGSSRCYFTVNSAGSLSMVGYSQTSFPRSYVEGIPTSSPIFWRAITLSDDLDGDGDADDPQNQKRVTVIVAWKDFSGPHESRLTTILRKI